MEPLFRGDAKEMYDAPVLRRALAELGERESFFLQLNFHGRTAREAHLNSIDDLAAFVPHPVVNGSVHQGWLQVRQLNGKGEYVTTFDILDIGYLRTGPIKRSLE